MCKVCWCHLCPSLWLQRKGNNFSFLVSKINILTFVCWRLLLWTKPFWFSRKIVAANDIWPVWFTPVMMSSLVRTNDKSLLAAVVVVFSQPAILISRLTTSQKEYIMDDQSSCEIVFASKIISRTSLKFGESYLCCNLWVSVLPTWYSACWYLSHTFLCWWFSPLYPLCQCTWKS